MQTKTKRNLIIGILTALMVLVTIGIHEWYYTGFFVGVFDGFMVITLGAFGIASVDKYLTGKNKPGSSDEETPVE